MPAWLTRVRLRLRAMWSRDHDQQLRAELQLHLDLLTDAYLAEGMSANDARARAHREFGNTTRVQEASHDLFSVLTIEHVLRDLRQAQRALWRSPGFTTVAIVTLGLGIGTTTAMFSVVYGVMLRPLPFPTADRLVQIIQVPSERLGQQAPGRFGVTIDQVTDWRATTRTLQEIGYYQSTAAAVTDLPTPIRLNGAAMSVSLFRALGVMPFRGRMFVDEDEQPGAPPIVMLSFATWRTRFASAEQILRRRITLNGRAHSIIGVMPDGFAFPSLASPMMSLNAEGEFAPSPEFWIPVAARPRPPGPATGGFSMGPAFALLRPGISLEQATAEVNTLMPARAGRRFDVELVSPRAEQTRTVRRVLIVFQTGVLFVLFIACANVVNLLFARAATRRHELAVRAALGASRAQLLRYATAEGLLIGAGGGLLGCVLAYQLVGAFRSLPPYLLPRMTEVRVDAVVLLTASVVSIGAGLCVGIVSALRTVWRQAPTISFVASARTSAPDQHHRPSRALLVAEVTTGVVLLAAATMLLDSFVKLTNVNRGFRSEDVFTFRLALPQRLQAAEVQHEFNDQLIAALKAAPGVQSVAATGGILGDSAIGFGLTIDGRRLDADVAFNTITAGVFGTLDIPLRGRDVTAADVRPCAQVAVVNEAFARQFFPDADPIGQRVQFQSWPMLEIIGVAGDTRMRAVTTPLRAALYVPRELVTRFDSATYVMRAPESTRSGSAIREVTARIDPQVVVFDATDLDTVLSRNVATPKFYGLTASAFGGVAVLLAALGLYGVLSYSVGAQTRELGIRLALGADSTDIVVSVMREMLAPVVIGLTIGTAAWIYLSRFIETLLYNTNPRDSATLVSIVGLFIAVAAIACYVPARRATRVDPLLALRAE